MGSFSRVPMAQNATILAAPVVASIIDRAHPLSNNKNHQKKIHKGAAMTSMRELYALGTEGSTWSVPQDFDVNFNWDYDDGRAAMMGLYAKGKEMQWDAATRTDW